jgi:hypothetical protein
MVKMMRKHIDYYYKCFDKKYESEYEKNLYERFNEYGYNFYSNNRRNINYDELSKKTNYKNQNINLKKRKSL